MSLANEMCRCGHLKIDHDALGCVMKVGAKFCQCTIDWTTGGQERLGKLMDEWKL